MGIRTDPLQQGFDGHSQTRFSIRVHDLAALFASEQSVILPIMSILRDSTAARTPFGCAIGIDPVQRNAVVKTTGFENPSENVRRNSQNLLVELSSFGLELGKPFDRNVGVESACKKDYLPDHLTQIRVNKISLAVSHPLEFLQRIEGLQHCSAFGEVNLLRPDLLTEIALPQYITFWCENGISKILVVDVYCKYVLLLWLWLRYFILLLGEISAYLKRWCQTIGLAGPSRPSTISGIEYSPNSS